MRNLCNNAQPADAVPAQRLVVHLYRDFYSKRGGIEDHILISTIGVGNVRLPFSGGFYARLLPYAFIRRAVRTVNAAGQPVIFYLHPWELDPEQPRLTAEIPYLYRLTHYYNLASTANKLEELLGEFRFAPLAELRLRL